MHRSELPAYLGEFVDVAEKYEGAMTDAGGFHEKGLGWDTMSGLPSDGPDPILVQAAGGPLAFDRMAGQLRTPLNWIAASVMLGMGQSVSR